MIAYHVTPGGGLDSLHRREHEIPVPGAHELLVRIRATALNARERSIIIRNDYPLPVKEDLIPLCDGAGDVVAIGEGVSNVRVADRATGIVFANWFDGRFKFTNAAQLGGSLDGLLAEYAVLRADAVAIVPEHLSYAEAATFPCAAVTAWNALTDGRPVHAGETVLTLGSGGVAVFALQFARALGAHVIAVTSSAHKAERLAGLGAQYVIESSAGDWSAAVRAYTDGRGVDHVIETGDGATLASSLGSLALEGEISLVSRQAAVVDPNGFFLRVASLRAVALGNRAHHRAMNDFVRRTALRPAIDRVFGFSEAPAAFAHLFDGDYFGKIVIEHPH